MIPEFVSVPMSELNSIEAYNMLASTVIPRPIAFVSTCSGDGVANLAPFSFFMVGGSNPPSLMYSPTLKTNGEAKDSLRNVLETGEFVVNTVHRAMAQGMNATSAEYPSEIDEWEIGGFTPMPSVIVRPARVAESLVQFECRVFKVIEHGNGAHAARYVIGEVVYSHLEKHIFEERSRLRTIGRLGGPTYTDLATSDHFEIIRPS